MPVEDRSRIHRELDEAMSGGRLYLPVGSMSGTPVDRMVEAAASRDRGPAEDKPETPCPLTKPRRGILALLQEIGEAVIHGGTRESYRRPWRLFP